jgi:hypothetical protein
MNTPNTASVAANLRSLIDEYWDAAYREGEDGRVLDPTGNAQRIRSAIDQAIAALASAPRQPSEAEQVCAEAYQVVGCLLSDAGLFETEQARKVLDNLSQARMIHKDVLPWSSVEATKQPLDERARKALAAQAAQAVSEGWRLAPVRPTLDMGWAYLDAARADDPGREHSFNWAGYRAALAAAPSAPAAVPMSPIAQRKLDDLIARGYQICGAMIERQHEDGAVTRGAVSVGGLVIWWHPPSPEAEHSRAAPSAPAAQGEPSEEMIQAGMEASCAGRPSIDDDSYVLSIWRAMHAARAAQQEGGA